LVDAIVWIAALQAAGHCDIHTQAFGPFGLGSAGRMPALPGAKPWAKPLLNIWALVWLQIYFKSSLAL